MATDHASVTKALRKLYSGISPDDLDRLAMELTHILDVTRAKGRDTRNLQLLCREGTTLGATLQTYREAAGITQREVAARFDCSPSKIMNIENDKVSASVIDVRSMLDLYDVTDPEIRSWLEQLARDTSRRGGRRGPRI